MFPMQNCSQDGVQFETLGNGDVVIAGTNTPSPSSNPPSLPVTVPPPNGDPLPDPNDPMPPEPEPPQVCVEGKVLGIYADPSESGEINEANFLGEITAYSGEVSSVENYNYHSYSAHPVVGPQPSGYFFNVFFYEGSDGLSVNFFGNVDAGGSSYNKMELDILISGNQNSDDVLLSDDNMELRLDGFEDGHNLYSGRFEYWSNTDGGVIGPLVDDDYKLEFRFNNMGDINDARFYSADGSSFQLNSDGDFTSFIIAYRSTQNCQEE